MKARRHKLLLFLAVLVLTILAFSGVALASTVNYDYYMDVTESSWTSPSFSHTTSGNISHTIFARYGSNPDHYYLYLQRYSSGSWASVTYWYYGLGTKSGTAYSMAAGTYRYRIYRDLSGVHNQMFGDITINY